MKPFLQGRPVQEGPALKSLSVSGPEALGKPKNLGGGDHGGHGDGPTVECVKQGDKVVRLIVTCSCGERIEIECLYPAGG